MTKADIVDQIHDGVGLSKKESSDLVELVFDVLKSSLETCGRIKVSGFGNFEVRRKHKRMGRNPQTGEAIEITARNVLTFKASQVLKGALNRETV